MEEESLNNTNTNTNNVPASLSPHSQPQPVMNMNMNMNSVNGGGGSLELFGEKIKKKRGRPRKYDSDGNLKIQYLNNNNNDATPQSQGFTLSSSSPTTSPFFSSSSEFSNSKKGRGNPSSAHNFASYGGAFAITAGVDFIPHVVTVHTGEDVAGKILSFAQKIPRGICVLSANGAISNVTLRQSGSSGGLLTYEGRFEILCLSGSYTASENNNNNNNNNGMMRSRSGGLSVSLAGPDGRVIGGGVAGLLIAASPIQLVLGSFIENGYKPLKRKYNRVAKPIISQANPELGENFHLIQKSQLLEQSQKRVEPVVTTSEKLNLDASPNDDADAATWNGSEEFSDQRISPDINISLPNQ